MGDFDPFAGRVDMPDATTDFDILMHVIKAALGIGLLSMQVAFFKAGLMLGLGTATLTTALCTHGTHMLVEVAHRVYYRDHKTAMTYEDVVTSVFENGPPKVQACATCTSAIVVFFVFTTYMGTCSVYAVFVARNIGVLLLEWQGEEYNVRFLIACLLIPFILLVWVPNLKKFAIVSTIANLFLLTGVLIICYYLFSRGMAPITDRKFADISGIPTAFGTVMFSVLFIGLVMPFENSMKYPTHFLGRCGVLVRGMIGVYAICTSLGFFGYWSFGDDTKATISLNMPIHEIPGQLVCILLSLSVFCTFGLQFVICLEIVWYRTQHLFPDTQLLANYVIRTLLAFIAVAAAFAAPSIGAFINLIGALGFSILGLIMPMLMDIILNYQDGDFGRWHWTLFKDILVIIFGTYGGILGTKDAIVEIIGLYE